MKIFFLLNLIIVFGFIVFYTKQNCEIQVGAGRLAIRRMTVSVLINL